MGRVGVSIFKLKPPAEQDPEVVELPSDDEVPKEAKAEEAKAEEAEEKREEAKEPKPEEPKPEEPKPEEPKPEEPKPEEPKPEEPKPKELKPEDVFGPESSDSDAEDPPRKRRRLAHKARETRPSSPA